MSSYENTLLFRNLNSRVLTLSGQYLHLMFEVRLVAFLAPSFGFQNRLEELKLRREINTVKHGKINVN